MSSKQAPLPPPQDSSASHLRGESEFIDDRARRDDECLVGLLTSPVAHGKIVKLDVSQALRVPGIYGIFTAKDVPHNRWGTIFQDQPLIASEKVNYVGEVIAVIAGASLRAILQAKEAITLQISSLPALLSIEAAKKAKSFIGDSRKIERGNFDQAFSESPHRLEGKLTLRGQDHFYLESQAAIAYPEEGNRLEIHSSSQHPTEVQHVVCDGLQLPAKDVVCVVKRMGGGFGGKESQAAPIGFYAALCAHRLHRPARLILNKDDDMLITGKRNPFEIDYRVAFEDSGRILALEARLFSDGGAYADLSTSIMERAMLHCDNAYYLPNVRILGQVCRTHVHPHTAFRGFGGPKGVALIENIIEEIATHLKLDALKVRTCNVYGGEGRNLTPYGQKVEPPLLGELFEKLTQSSNYWKRREEIERHNQLRGGTIRGLSMTAVKFGISFTTRFLNQANALVNVHRDGTIQVSTGATEMGQGVNTKIAQVVADVFGVKSDQVRVMPTSTEKNHNTSPTAASSGSDLNGQAAELAALRIRNRLSVVASQLFPKDPKRWPSRTSGLGTEEELKCREDATPAEEVFFEEGFVGLKKNPGTKMSFADLVEEAYLSRVQLGDYGFYRYPQIDFNKLTGQGNPFHYFTQGVAASEVQLDRFTGELKVLRVDLLMDLGRPLNAGIDRGQVTGAFVQGMGWVTTEKLVYDAGGKLLTHSPSTYKIPNIQDTPRVFHVAFFENDLNQKNLRGSKAVGEPPLVLGISVWTAIKDALRGAGVTKKKSLEVPATQEQIILQLRGH
jgi:xanthine dehydrogenase large subunit